MSELVPASYQQWIDNGNRDKRQFDNSQMTKIKQSNADSRLKPGEAILNGMGGNAPTYTTSFIDAYCRRDITWVERAHINIIIAAALAHPDMHISRELQRIFGRFPKATDAQESEDAELSAITVSLSKDRSQDKTLKSRKR